MIQNITNYLFIENSHQTLTVAIAMYISFLLFLNKDSIAAIAKRTNAIL